MKRSIKSVMAIAVFMVASSGALAAVIPAGSVVTYRVGSGTGSLVNTGNAVFVDVYNLSGVLQSTIPLPTTGADAFIASGTASSEGFLTVSPGGKYVTITGYNRAVGGTGGIAGTASATVARVAAVIDAETGAISYTKLTDWASGNNPRSAVTDDGTNLWLAGATGGVRYTTVGSTTSTQINSPATLLNFRQVNIFSGQLYASNQSTAGGNTIPLGTVGTGLPTASPATYSALPGFPVLSGSSIYSYFFADLDAGVAGDDTLYVADDGTAALKKYSLVAGSWTLNGTIGVDADDYRGLTGYVDGTNVVLYATRLGGSGATGGGQLVQISDTSGYNGALSATPVLLNTAATNTALRGVGVVPEPSALGLLVPAGLLVARRRK